MYLISRYDFHAVTFIGHHFDYGRTPLYGQPINMTTLLLRPLYSGLKKAQSVIFLFKELL